MQHRKQQPTGQYKTTGIESKSNDDDQTNSGGEQNDQEEDAAATMNYNDTTYTNTIPRDQYSYEYEGMSWPQSPGATSEQQDTSDEIMYSSPGGGYASFQGTAGMVNNNMEPATPTGSPLTREEQATDTSYTMLLRTGERNAAATASADGKIQEPHLHDVLCGRGGSINSHPGNRVFRGWIAERRESYMLADSKSDKTVITSTIFKRIQDQNPPGRFLQKVDGEHGRDTDPYSLSGHWVEIDDSKALSKISQALREGAPAFRAMHDKKPIQGKKKKKQTKPSQRKKSTGRKQQQNKDMEMEETSPKRKEPPEMEMEVAPFTPTREVPPMPDLRNTNGRELDVLYPTSNNVFATQSNLLSSYPLVHMEDYTRPINDVARAIPTPQSSPNPKRQRASMEVTPTASGSRLSSGACNTTPKLPFKAPNTPLVSPYTPIPATPGFSPLARSLGLTSPYGEAKAAWDAIAFLPNLSPTHNHSPPQRRPSFNSVHSLSFSEGDVESIGSFQNPFEGDSNGNGNGNSNNNRKMPPAPPDLDTPDQAPDQAARFPPPPLTTPPQGLSFDRIRPLQGFNSRQSSRSRSSRRESSISNRSLGSISNHHSHSKRKSIS